MTYFQSVCTFLGLMLIIAMVLWAVFAFFTLIGRRILLWNQFSGWVEDLCAVKRTQRRLIEEFEELRKRVDSLEDDSDHADYNTTSAEAGWKELE